MAADPPIVALDDATIAKLAMAIVDALRPKKRGKGPASAAELAAVDRVFQVWCTVMDKPEQPVGKVRTELILARLRDGRTVEQMEQVLQWASHDDWIRGRDPKSRRAWDGLDTLLRPTNFDKYLSAALAAGAKASPTDARLAYNPDAPSNGRLF